MRASVDRVELPLTTPFGISRGTRHAVDAFVVELAEGDHVGYGAATPAERHGETPGSIGAALPPLLDAIDPGDDPHALDDAEAALSGSGAPAAARAGVSIALHDLVANRLDRPLYRYWGLEPCGPVTSSITVGLDEPDVMAGRAAAAVDAGFGVLKVKLGGDADVATVEAVRDAAPDAVIRVDANEAWTPAEAERTIDAIRAFDVELVEQPVPAADPDGLRAVHASSPLPIAVDESVSTAADVPAIADRADVVVMKVMQAGGLRAARRGIEAARDHGLDVMIGCRPESNAGIAAACHLTPSADYVDLDGALLLDADPFDGIPMPGGRIDLAAVESPGTGATPIDAPDGA